MSASSCNQSIYFHLAVHVLNTLFRASVSRACVLTYAINAPINVNPVGGGGSAGKGRRFDKF